MTTVPARTSGTAGLLKGRVVPWLALIPPTLWASSVVAAKVVVSDVSPFTAATVRFLGATALLWILWLFLPGQRQRVERGDWKWLALAGFFQTSLYFALQYAGVEFTSASNASVIVNTRPIFVVLLAVLFLNEKLTLQTSAAILLGFIGILAISTAGSLSAIWVRSEHSWGDLLILLNALSGAIGLVLTKRVLVKYRPFPALVYIISFGTLGLLPFGAWEVWRNGGIAAVGWMPWLVLAYQAVFCSLAAHILWNHVLVRMEASQAAAYLFMQPALGVFLSWLILGEQMTGSLLIGGLLVGAAAYISARRQNGTS